MGCLRFKAHISFILVPSFYGLFWYMWRGIHVDLHSVLHGDKRVNKASQAMLSDYSDVKD